METEERGRKFESDPTHTEDHDNAEFVFKANPLPADNVFIPKKSTKPLTQSQDIVLHTEERSKERSAFDHEIAVKEQQQESLRKIEESKKMVSKWL